MQFHFVSTFRTPRVGYAKSLMKSTCSSKFVCIKISEFWNRRIDTYGLLWMACCMIVASPSAPSAPSGSITSDVRSILGFYH
ncbi:sexual differentiation process protein Isp4 [Aspergillus luchuensis]|uniref:Sexual differentiation process protein Isp4 n=1 Tax=Aspergillus kawachii TaxID=1069201 RepID=A0A146FMW8_ASPKA|nr:sexual differentiation process protein Isp4 [Aspergillus luchuensis]